MRIVVGDVWITTVGDDVADRAAADNTAHIAGDVRSVIRGSTVGHVVTNGRDPYVAYHDAHVGP